MKEWMREWSLLVNMDCIEWDALSNDHTDLKDWLKDLLGNLSHFIFCCRVLEKYYIGELISRKYPTYPEQGYVLIYFQLNAFFPFKSSGCNIRLNLLSCRVFFTTLRDRVKKYFKENNKVTYHERGRKNRKEDQMQPFFVVLDCWN